MQHVLPTWLGFLSSKQKACCLESFDRGFYIKSDLQVGKKREMKNGPIGSRMKHTLEVVKRHLQKDTDFSNCVCVSYILLLICESFRMAGYAQQPNGLGFLHSGQRKA